MCHVKVIREKHLWPRSMFYIPFHTECWSIDVASGVIWSRSNRYQTLRTWVMFRFCANLLTRMTANRNNHDQILGLLAIKHLYILNVNSPMKAAGISVKNSFWLRTGTPCSVSCISRTRFSSCKKIVFSWNCWLNKTKYIFLAPRPESKR